MINLVNMIKSKICVPNKTEVLRQNALTVIAWIHESKTLIEYISW